VTTHQLPDATQKTAVRYFERPISYKYCSGSYLYLSVSCQEI
jgi:hypothetical protein